MAELQVVDVHAAVARARIAVDGGDFAIPIDYYLGYQLREHLRLIISIFRRQAHYYVKTHLARGLQTRLEPDLAQDISYFARNFDCVAGRAALRIDVEQQPVGTLEMLDARGPHVNRDRREVSHVGERLFAVEDEI